MGMMSTTTTKRPARTTETERDQCVVLREIGWEGYCKVLKARGERNVPRMIYLDGSLILTSPSFTHEHFKARLNRLVTEVVFGLGIPCNPAGSTTFRRRAKRGGVEGDQKYYLANEAKIRGKTEINLRVDPRPDLAIEVVRTHHADAAIEVYRRLKVPEVWIYSHDGLRILELRPDRRYAEVERSAAFPALTAGEIVSWIERPQSESETAWITEVRRWVVEVLAPRHRERTKRETLGTD
jgi:Uma2 family endonuclease